MLLKLLQQSVLRFPGVSYHAVVVRLSDFPLVFAAAEFLKRLVRLRVSRLLLWNWLLLPHQDTRLLLLPLLPAARLRVRLLLGEAVREELDPPLRLSLLL